jgi:hypothetical protein
LTDAQLAQVNDPNNPQFSTPPANLAPAPPTVAPPATPEAVTNEAQQQAAAQLAMDAMTSIGVPSFAMAMDAVQAAIANNAPAAQTQAATDAEAQAAIAAAQDSVQGVPGVSFGDVGITAAPGPSISSTSSPSDVAAFGDALSGAIAAQAAEAMGAPTGPPSGDSPEGPSTGESPTGESPGTAPGTAGTAGDASGPGPGDGVGGGGIGW